MDSEPTQQNEETTPAYSDAAGAGAARRYDFQASRRLTENQLGSLERVSKRFLREFAESLSALIRRPVTPGAVSLKQVESSEDGVEPAHTGLVVSLRIEPLDTSASLLLDSPLAFSLLEALLGSKTAEALPSVRELTEIELLLLEDLHPVLERELQKAWRTVTALGFRVTGQRTDLKPGPWDGVVMVTLDLEIAGAEGHITVLYPPQIGKVLKDTASEEGQTASPGRPTMQRTVFEHLKNAILRLDGCLPGATVRLGDLLDLQEGDLLRLDVPLGRPIDVLVNGERRLQGQLIHSNRKKVLNIQRLFHPAGSIPSSKKVG